MISFFTEAWNWLKDPKNKSIRTLIGVVILIAIILMQCSQNRGLKNDLDAQKGETQRIQNNYEALNDTIRQGKINDTTWLAEKKALSLSIKELKQGYSDMLVGFEQFKKQTPKVIEKLTVVNNEKIREVPVYVKVDSLGNKTLYFSDNKVFADSNYRKLSGMVPVSTKIFGKDSTEIDAKNLGYYTQVYAGLSNFTLEQGIKLKVGLFQDPKTKKVTIAATTNYPGITFTKLEGADIMSDEVSRKAARNFRKTWGLGLNVGYGAGVNLKTSQVFFGPQAGISLNYTPKWLQWGK